MRFLIGILLQGLGCTSPGMHHDELREATENQSQQVPFGIKLRTPRIPIGSRYRLFTAKGGVYLLKLEKMCIVCLAKYIVSKIALSYK